MIEKIKDNIGFIIVLLVAIVLCIGAVAFVQWYWCIDLSNPNAANIGAAIGGITAPVVGLATISLLYLALDKQRQANRLNKESFTFKILNERIDKLETRLDKSTAYLSFRPGSTGNYYYGKNAFDQIEVVYNECEHPTNKEFLSETFNLSYTMRDLQLDIEVGEVNNSDKKYLTNRLKDMYFKYLETVRLFKLHFNEININSSNKDCYFTMFSIIKKLEEIRFDLL